MILYEMMNFDVGGIRMSHVAQVVVTLTGLEDYFLRHLLFT